MRRAGVAELADAQDLGSCTERCRGSTPLSCNTKKDEGRRMKDEAKQNELAQNIAVFAVKDADIKIAGSILKTIGAIKA